MTEMKVYIDAHLSIGQISHAVNKYHSTKQDYLLTHPATRLNAKNGIYFRSREIPTNHSLNDEQKANYIRRAGEITHKQHENNGTLWK